jgi:hypothetical protein
MVTLDRGYLAITEFLLQHGCVATEDENKVYMLGRLMTRAINEGKSAFVEVYIEHLGVEIERLYAAVLVEGIYRPVSLVSSAAFWNRTEVLRVLLSRGVGGGVEDPRFHVRPLRWAIKHDNLEMMEVFIEHGAVLAPRDKGEDWPLLWAVRDGSPDMLALLLRKTSLPRWGSYLSRVFSRAVEERASDGIKQLVRLHKKNTKWTLI